MSNCGSALMHAISGDNATGCCRKAYPARFSPQMDNLSDMLMPHVHTLKPRGSQKDTLLRYAALAIIKFGETPAAQAEEEEDMGEPVDLMSPRTQSGPPAPAPALPPAGDRNRGNPSSHPREERNRQEKHVFFSSCNSESNLGYGRTYSGAADVEQES
eukprot:gene31590-6783_t